MIAQTRVSDFLLDLAAWHDAGAAIDLSMSRRAMAEHLGLSVESLCRVLSRFAEVGFIAIPNVSQVEIIDLPALKMPSDDV